MSMPISECLIAAAARGDVEKKKSLFDRMDYNFSKGGFTLVPCNHNPLCMVTPEEITKLEKEYVEHLRQLRAA